MAGSSSLGQTRFIRRGAKIGCAIGVIPPLILCALSTAVLLVISTMAGDADADLGRYGLIVIFAAALSAAAVLGLLFVGVGTLSGLALTIFNEAKGVVGTRQGITAGLLAGLLTSVVVGLMVAYSVAGQCDVPDILSIHFGCILAQDYFGQVEVGLARAMVFVGAIWLVTSGVGAWLGRRLAQPRRDRRDG